MALGNRFLSVNADDESEGENFVTLEELGYMPSSDEGEESSGDEVLGRSRRLSVQVDEEEERARDDDQKKGKIPVWKRAHAVFWASLKAIASAGLAAFGVRATTDFLGFIPQDLVTYLFYSEMISNGLICGLTRSEAIYLRFSGKTTSGHEKAKEFIGGWWWAFQFVKICGWISNVVAFVTSWLGGMTLISAVAGLITRKKHEELNEGEVILYGALSLFPAFGGMIAFLAFQTDKAIHNMNAVKDHFTNPNRQGVSGKEIGGGGLCLIFMVSFGLLLNFQIGSAFEEIYNLLCKLFEWPINGSKPDLAALRASDNPRDNVFGWGIPTLTIIGFMANSIITALSQVFAVNQRGIEIYNGILGLKNDPSKRAHAQSVLRQAFLKKSGWPLFNLLFIYATLHDLFVYAFGTVVGSDKALDQMGCDSLWVKMAVGGVLNFFVQWCLSLAFTQAQAAKTTARHQNIRSYKDALQEAKNQVKRQAGCHQMDPAPTDPEVMRLLRRGAGKEWTDGFLPTLFFCGSKCCPCITGRDEEKALSPASQRNINALRRYGTIP